MTPGHGNGKVLVDDPLLDEDSEDVRSGENNLSSTKHDEARLARGTKKRCLIMVTAISSLCYARSQYANRFQVQAGYYMTGLAKSRAGSQGLTSGPRRAELSQRF